MANILIACLISACLSEDSNTIQSIDFDGNEITIVLEIVHSDLVNPYTMENQIVIDKTHFGIYPHSKIIVTDLNGNGRVETVGGYVGLYSDHVELRLLFDKGSSLQPYPGNGVYTLHKTLR